jgi:hypothetical protein
VSEPTGSGGAGDRPDAAAGGRTDPTASRTPVARVLDPLNLAALAVRRYRRGLGLEPAGARRPPGGPASGRGGAR